MHLIQSNASDHSTNDVLSWTFFLQENADIFRINDTTVIKKSTYKLSNKEGESVIITSDQGNLQTDEIHSFWYRRGRFSYAESPTKTNDPFTQEISFKIQANFNREQNHLSNYLYHIIGSQNSINTFQENFTNKIHNLSFARQAGLKIPDILITDDMRELVRFSSLHEKIITKDIEMNPVKVSYDPHYKIAISPTVQLLTYKDILQLSQKYTDIQTAMPTFYQEYIEKKYELRIFYFKDRFYTMAIFSQANEKTKIDFRNYDTEKPNRCVPYQLPEEIEERLNSFMHSIALNCGSIDMIYTPEGEYVFLEVNPIGQFQWLSTNCNYDIERQLALDLIQKV